MDPVEHPRFNRTFRPPPDLVESQCGTVRAWVGHAVGGSCDGLSLVVTAWRPTAEELAALNRGEPLFVTFYLDGLPPHYPSVDFHAATHPA